MFLQSLGNDKKEVVVIGWVFGSNVSMFKWLSLLLTLILLFLPYAPHLLGEALIPRWLEASHTMKLALIASYNTIIVNLLDLQNVPDTNVIS